MNFFTLSKPPTSSDEREMYRWQYIICEIINGFKAFNHILFNTAPTYLPPDVGTIYWNAIDECLNVNTNASVTLNVGEEEFYPIVVNNTLTDIPNGTLCGFGGVDGGVEVVPYIADGTMDPWYIAGVATQDLPVNIHGRITKFGYVHNVNTTGGAEVWAAGDILYASPTVAGGMTKVKPTAPNLMIPVAVVRTVSATAGILLVRVLPQQRLHYATFSDSTTQTAAVANTIYAIKFNTTEIASGFSVQNDLAGNPTKIVAGNAGLYNFQFSVELNSSSAALRDVYIWPRINGVDIPNSASKWTIKSNLEMFVPAWNFVLSLAAGEYFQLVWVASDVGVTLEYSVAQASPFVRPAIPSVILTVTQANQ